MIPERTIYKNKDNRLALRDNLNVTRSTNMNIVLKTAFVLGLTLMCCHYAGRFTII